MGRIEDLDEAIDEVTHLTAAALEVPSTVVGLYSHTARPWLWPAKRSVVHCP